MRKVSVFYLEPGMKVGRDLHVGRGEALLKTGVSLTTGYIKKLINLGIPFVYIDDGLFPDLVIEDVITQETRVAAVHQVRSILVEARESGGLVIEPQPVYSTVRRITSELLSSKSLMLNLVDLRTQDDYTFAHSVNVSVLSVMTGISLGYTKKQLATLGVGALLHDLGKVKIPDAILNKPGKLTSEEFEIMKKHTSYGYELIRSSKGLEAVHALIAHQHHESYDGSGYPLGIKGEAYHEYSQIISIADKFDALTADRIYRKAFPPHEAYEMCAGSGNLFVKDAIVKAFLRNIAAYPSGTLVELNNGYTGVVVDTPRGCSLFPRVRLLRDPDRRPVPPAEIALSEERNLVVVRVLTEVEIREFMLEKDGLLQT